MIESWLKYLEFLQAAIARMAANSFAMKGWSVAFGTAIIGLTAKDGSPQLASFALLPALAFWLLPSAVGAPIIARALTRARHATARSGAHPDA